jgi:hypothetical protein
VHRAVRICIASDHLATNRCPAEQVEERVYRVFPSVAQDWAQEQGIPQPPTEPCPVHGGSVGASGSDWGVVVTSPDEGSVFRISPALPRSDQRIALVARIEGMRPVAWVEFRVDGLAVGHATAPPWQVLWVLEPGAHTVQAVAVDSAGHQVFSTLVRFTVS